MANKSSSLIHLFLICTTLSCLSVLSTPSYLHAESISILHITGSELPPPGVPIKLSAHVNGVDNLTGSMRVYVVSDGRVLDKASSNIQYSPEDLPEYTFDIHSPIAELSYQFVYSSPTGQVISSQRYEIRRPCLPKFELPASESISSGDKRLQKALIDAKRLEFEVMNLDEALKLIKDLKIEMAK